MPDHADATRPARALEVDLADLDGMSIGVAVAGAVAASADRNVLALEPLPASVDVDSLETLLAGDSGVCEVSFVYADHEVTVTPERLRVAPIRG